MRNVTKILGRLNKWGLSLAPLLAAVAATGAAQKWT